MVLHVHIHVACLEHSVVILLAARPLVQALRGVGPQDGVVREQRHDHEHLHVHACMCIYMLHVCATMSTCMCIHACACAYNMYVHVHVRPCAPVCACACAYYMYVHAHVY